MILIHKRVEELAKQADEYLLEKVQEENRSSWAQVFAELIVTECANTLIKWKNEPFPYDPEFGAKLIKQHFGIEE